MPPSGLAMEDCGGSFENASLASFGWWIKDRDMIS
jgi:hypothetical protein